MHSFDLINLGGEALFYIQKCFPVPVKLCCKNLCGKKSQNVQSKILSFDYSLKKRVFKMLLKNYGRGQHVLHAIYVYTNIKIGTPKKLGDIIL